jgi:ribulose-bisphosphate carboxylase large chain
MATVAGNLFELNEFSGLRLLNIEIPESYQEKYDGPQFGIRGTRTLTGVHDRPIIGTIIKPSVGLSPQQTALETGKLVKAGLDFLKDDELMGDSPHSPFEDRVEAVMSAIHQEADRSGKKAMFAFNISGDIDDMLRRHDFVMSKGGNCVMVSLNWIGISALVKLRSHSQLPIHGHRNGWGLMYRSPYIGIDFNAYQKIWRWAGADHIHTNGLRNKFCESDESVIASIKACQEPGRGETVMPVISSGQWAGQAVDTYQAIGNADVMYVCGGGIVAHPSGIEAGVQSVRHAWDAALAGTSLEKHAAQSPALKEALEFFGKRAKK